MALVVEFTCELPNGVHARPASHVETLCNTFIRKLSGITCVRIVKARQKRAGADWYQIRWRAMPAAL